MEGNNVSRKISNDTKIWLKQEKHLLDELMGKIENEKKVKQYNRYVRAEDLYNKAIRLIEEIESGELDDETIKKKVEEITLLFKAIEDYSKDDKDRSLNNNPHRDNEHGGIGEEEDMVR